jgi:hypothetical protein
MKGRLGVTALAFTILAACSKNDIQIRKEAYLSQRQIAKQIGGNLKIYSSGWETVPAWDASASPDAVHFSYAFHVPEPDSKNLYKSAVLVFARNLWNADPNFKEMEGKNKPMLMPFYYLPYFEKLNYTEQWNYSVENKKINVLLTVKGSDDAALPDKKIQLRFIVIPQQVLQQKKQTTETLRKLSYNQLLQIFDLTS